MSFKASIPDRKHLSGHPDMNFLAGDSGARIETIESDSFDNSLDLAPESTIEML